METIRHLKWTLGCCALALAVNLAAAAESRQVGYNRQIRPLLSDKCFLCHGPDQGSRKAGLRLDQRESALKKAIVPGKPEDSELIRRILADDPHDVMPPPETHKSLSPEEKELLRAWIAEGAEYEPHWAYLPPVKPEVPAGTNAVDYLVRERLARLGLQPSPEADRRTLARRLYFDLIGLPPSPAEVAAFEQDTSPDACQTLVERLLSSPHYGERMAISWLDAARYADTIGYHSDNPRNVWPYRDYVIRAFNRNKPFDQFTREQIAGDLLPDSGQEQKVGSAFNRLLLSTEEGGAQPKDYEYRMLTDRVRAVGSVWLGQTFGCAACHDHKFDPITMKDFYSLGAVFADIKEPIIGAREPGMVVPSESQTAELERLQAEAARLKTAYTNLDSRVQPEFEAWRKNLANALEQERLWTVLTPAEASASEGVKLTPTSEGGLLAVGKNPDKDTYQLTFTNLPTRLTALRLDALPHDSLPAKGPGRAGNGNFVVTEIVLRIRNDQGTETTLALKGARADIEQSAAAEGNPYGAWTAAAAIDGDAKGPGFGWAILPETGKPHHLLLELATPVQLGPQDRLQVEIRQNLGNGNHTLGHFKLLACADPQLAAAPAPWPPAADLVALISPPADQADSAQARLFSRFKETTPSLQADRAAIAKAEKAAADYEGQLPRCLVTVSTEEKRTVHILPRGDFLKETNGPIVQAALPAYLLSKSAAPAEGPITRLELANWLVARENPLTARVTVNRLWKQFFGLGLSRVLDDLGSQGETPPNQALLDWLACEFMDSGWDVKHIVRILVTSYAYRQVSTPSAELAARDPYNREIACQGRWRLDAELVRDTALSLAGALNLAIGGASVKPYQPPGYWENLNFPTRTYEASTGPDQFRRGLYTWWQRSYLHPSLLAFDAPTREECAAERNRSNIPQQALVLLNDPTYVEASRAFGMRILKEAGPQPRERVAWAWRQALARDPADAEMQNLLDLQSRMQAEYAANGDAAAAFLKVGEIPVPEGISQPELAAWSQVARVILNLHETITRN